MTDSLQYTVTAVHNYWDSHTLGLQYVTDTSQEHYRALPVRRDGLKAAPYKFGFKPVYNLIPEPVAKHFAYKYSVTAVKI